MTLQPTVPAAQLIDAERWLQHAVRLATENVAAGGGPFGALVVRGDELVATGTNRVTRDHDPTAHAEVVAIREACRRLGDFRLDQCALVTSCEPCPLCLAAALWSRVGQVVYAADRFDAADAGFDDLAFYQLFETPRDAWSVPVHHITVDGAGTPFAAWNANPVRVEY